MGNVCNEKSDLSIVSSKIPSVGKLPILISFYPDLWNPLSCNSFSFSSSFCLNSSSSSCSSLASLRNWFFRASTKSDRLIANVWANYWFDKTKQLGRDKAYKLGDNRRCSPTNSAFTHYLRNFKSGKNASVVFRPSKRFLDLKTHQ